MLDTVERERPVRREVVNAGPSAHHHIVPSADGRVILQIDVDDVFGVHEGCLIPVAAGLERLRLEHRPVGTGVRPPAQQ